MFFKSKFVRATLMLSVVFCVFVAVLADTVRLKDGSVIKGKVIGFSDGKFLIVIGEGNRQRQITYYADEVERIEFDSNPSVPSNSIRIGNTDYSTPKPTPTVVVSNNNSSSNNSSNSNRSNSNNVIIVGGNRNTNSNQTANNNNSKPVNNNTNSSSSNTLNQPISLKVRVLADNTSNGWTNSLFVVKRGQKIRITGSGRVSLGNGRYSTPSGVNSLPDNDKLIKNESTGGLIAVIGDDNNDFIFIGNGREFTAQRDGFLFLGINEGNLNDNSGAYDVVIEVQ